MNTYVILGASGDIGIEYIRHLEESNESAVVLAFYNRSFERLAKLKCNNITLIPIRCDLSDCVETERVFRQVAKEYNNITHFISFAFGRLKYDRVTAFSADDVLLNFKIQISSCAIALSYIIPIMKQNKFGRVVILTSSVTTGTPPLFMSEYTIIKYASLGMIKSYAAECIKYNITVNGLAPSMVVTKMWDGISPIILEKNVMNHPLKRAVSYDEINQCIDYLVSKNAGYITGENINLSGGEVI